MEEGEEEGGGEERVGTRRERERQGIQQFNILIDEISLSTL